MSQPNARRTLERRALQAMIEHAVFDWKSAVVLALTILLTALAPSFPFFNWQWQPWYWVVGGAVAWGALIASMLTDPAFGARVVAEMLRRDFNPARIENKELQSQIIKALEYRQRITEASSRAREGLIRDHLQETARQIDEWIANIYTLAARLDAYQQDDMLHQDSRSVPQAIKNLQVQLQDEDDDTVRDQMQRTIQAKEQQLATLKHLENMMQKADLQMDSTITALGTVYSQLQLLGVKDIDSGRAQRLRQDIGEQVNQLHDLVSSVDEVYARRA